MRDLSSMSRNQLVRALVAPRPRTNANQNPLQPMALDVGRIYRVRNSLAQHRLAIARELLLRDLAATMQETPLLTHPKAVTDFLMLKYGRLEHEVFVLLFLNCQSQLIACEEMFRGTLAATSVHPREVVKAALRTNAAGVLMAHNHPSNRVEPSSADRLITQQLKTALALIDVKVLDHIIVAGTTSYSFAEKGLI